MSASDDSWRRTVLLEADRLHVAAAVLGSIFLVVLSLTWLDVVGVVRTGPMRNLFAGVVTGVFTVVSIILAINQLVLSRVFGSPDELEERMDATIEFRRRLEEHADVGAAPTDPGAFLAETVEALGDAAGRLRAVTDEEAVDYGATLEAYADEVGSDLRGTSGTFAVLSTVLRDNYSENIRRARHLRRRRDLSADARDALDEMVELLRTVGVARQYFKTLYLQQELAKISRLLMYLGVPALLVAALAVLLYAREGGPPISGAGLELVVAAALTLSFAPLVVLLSYVLRIATIARLTASVGPFTPQEE